MKSAKISFTALMMALVFALSPLTANAQEAAPFDGQSAPGKVIQFSFENEEWEEVIDWFAEQTGLSWRAISKSKFPKGTFTLQDRESYTPFEALDQLNYALRLQEPPYTIIRNRNQLILTEASRELPVELIPKVTADELDQRGDYEILSCQFDLGTLNVQEVEEDLRVSLSQKYVRHAKSLPALNAFFARGPGSELKSIRKTIEALTHANALTYSMYTLKHYDPEQFLATARGLLKIAPDEYERADGSLSIGLDPSGGRLFVYATPEAHEEFTKVANLLDVEPQEGDSGMERLYTKSYTITTDAEMARKVVETHLDGTTATIGQNEVTGAIILRGTESQHKIAKDVIDTIQGEEGSTKIVELQNASASTILEAVSSLLNLSSSSADNANAPSMLANTSQNFIMIHGTPQQVFKVSSMIAQLDQAQGRDPNRIRTNARVIEMSPEKRDKLLGNVPDYWPSTGRKNRLRIIMPDERVQDKLDSERQKMRIPQDTSTRFRFPQKRRVVERSIREVRTVAYQQIIEKTPAEAKMASSVVPAMASSESGGSRYTPPTEVQSIPGADLTIKATPFGVLIESDDLDALDDLEDIFRSQTINDAVDQTPSIFYVKFRKVASVKADLESMFGLASGSGGSDGGGGIMSGIVDNVAGEGTGDLLGGLLGGSSMGSSSDGAIELTGDVQLGMSVPLNMLWVSGATESDLNFIQDAIDLFDQASPPHNPELVGQTYSIPILHRSPQGVFDHVSKMFPDYIVGGPSAEGQNGGGNGGGENGINQMARMMRGMAGGGGQRGGGGGNNSAAAAEEAPKARISLDEETGQLLVIGPKFIYEQIHDFVVEIDKAELSEAKPFEILPAEYASAGAIEILRGMFGPKIQLGQESEGESGTDAQAQAQNGRNGQSQQGTNGRTNQSSRAAVQAEFRRQGINPTTGATGGRGGAQRGGGGAQRGGGGGQRGGGRR